MFTTTTLVTLVKHFIYWMFISWLVDTLLPFAFIALDIKTITLFNIKSSLNAVSDQLLFTEPESPVADLLEPTELLSGSLYFTDPASPIMSGIIEFHELAMVLVTFIVSFVGFTLFRCVFLFYDRKDGRKPDRFIHHMGVEIVWTVLPALLLLNLVIPSLSLLYSIDELPLFQGTLKCIGHQWNWTYEYNENKILVNVNAPLLQKTLFLGHVVELSDRTSELWLARNVLDPWFGRFFRDLLLARLNPNFDAWFLLVGFWDCYLSYEGGYKLKELFITSLSFLNSLEPVFVFDSFFFKVLSGYVDLIHLFVDEAVFFYARLISYIKDTELPLGMGGRGFVGFMSPFVWKLGFRFIFENGGVGILDELGIDFSSFFPWDHCRYGYMSAYFLNKSIVYGQTLEFLELIYDWVFSNFYALRRLPRSETIKEFNDVLKLMDTRLILKPSAHIQKPFTFCFYSFKTESYLVEEAVEGPFYRLLSVDNTAKIPSKTHIRLLITSADVLHSWSVPSLGIKVDACPGRLNQASTFLNRLGVRHYGQCSELCGVNHGFMPVVLESVLDSDLA